MNIRRSPNEVIHKLFLSSIIECCVPDSSKCWCSAVNRQNPLSDAADVAVGGNKQQIV